MQPKLPIYEHSDVEKKHNQNNMTTTIYHFVYATWNKTKHIVCFFFG